MYKYYAHAILLMLALGTAALTFATYKKSGEDNFLHFETYVAKADHLVIDSFDQRQALLSGALGLFYASDNVTTDEWNTFVETLQLKQYYADIVGFGYIRNIKESGGDHFYVSDHVPLQESVTQALSRQLVEIKKAMHVESLVKRASRLGVVSTSIIRVPEMQKEDKNRGVYFLISMPVIKRTDGNTNIGLVYTLVDAQAMFDDVVSDFNSRVGLNVRSLGTSTDVLWLYRSEFQPFVSPFVPGLVDIYKFHDVILPRSNMTLRINSYPTRSFDYHFTILSAAKVALIGVIFSILVFTLFRLLLELYGGASFKLKEANARLELAEAKADMGHWYFDLPSRKLFWSHQVYLMHGVDPEDYTPEVHEAVLFYHEEDRELVEQSVDSAIHSAKSFSFVARLKRTDGGQIYVRVHGYPEANNKGEVFRVFGIVQDITQQVEYQKQIEQSNLAKTEFLASMSHELRTPMNGMLGTANLLSMTELDQKQQKYINVIQDSGLMLIGIIDEILDYSRIEAGYLELYDIVMQLRDVVTTQCALLQPLAMDKDLEYRLEIDPNIPEYIYADPIRIKQVLGNLIGNAIKFTDAGEVFIKVETLTEERNKIKVSVTDSGVGLSSEEAKKIFIPFEQVIEARVNSRQAGTGLGLPISMKISEAMGGAIGVVSEYGGGSTFWFTFIFTEPSEEEVSDYLAKKNMLSAQVRSDANVLVVEDVLTNQFVIKHMLEEIGCSVALAGNGKECLQKLSEEVFDLILMDCNMPVMDGYEATSEIRHRGNTVPIIALTANALKGDAERCSAAGMDDYITKPVIRDNLITALRRFLDIREVVD